MVFQWEFVCCSSLLIKVPGTTWWLSPTWAQNNVLPPWTISLNPTQRGNNALSRPLYHHRYYVYITSFKYFSYCFCIHRTCNATLKHVWLQSSAAKWIPTGLFWWYCAVSSYKFLQTFPYNFSVPSSGVTNAANTWRRDRKFVPKMSVTNYHFALSNNTEERSSCDKTL